MSTQSFIGDKSEEPLRIQTKETATVDCVANWRTHRSKHGLTESGSDNGRMTPRSTRGSVLASHSPLSTCRQAKQRQARLETVLNVEKKSRQMLPRAAQCPPRLLKSNLLHHTEGQRGDVSQRAPCKDFEPLQVNSGPLEQISAIISL